MKIKLSPQILKHFPGIGYTVILIRDIANLRKISSLTQLLRGQEVVAKNELKKPDKRNLFERVTNPTLDDGDTFLESYLLASKVKKIQNGKELEGANNLVNFLNLISLKFFLPLHGFDMDQAAQDYTLQLYSPKKGKKAPEPDFLPATANIAIWFPNLAGLQDEELDHLIGEINAILHKYLHSQITEVYHLDSEKQEVDLGYTSELETEYQKHLAELPQSPPIAPAAADQETSDLPPTQITSTSTVTPETTDVIDGDSSDSESATTSEVTEATTTVTSTPLLHASRSTLSASDPAFQRDVQLLTAKQQLLELLAAAVSSLYSAQITQSGHAVEDLLEIEYPKDHSHGDFATNIAMKLTKLVGEPPQQIAEKIRQAMLADETAGGRAIVQSIETVAPGFINFRLTLDYFKSELAHLLAAGDDYGRSHEGAGKQIMIEFGSLNMAKPFGAHHFLTTVIGQTLVNLHKALDYQVLSADFPGDWGTQFGKCLYALKHWGEREIIDRDPMNELLKLYVRFHEEAEQDKTLEDAARAEFQKLEAGDSENLALWQWIIEVSQRDLDNVYQTLGVHHDCRFPESRYNQACQELLEKGKRLGVFQEGTLGAYVVNFEAEKLPTAIVQKGDGTSLYITRDLASIQDRLTQYPDLMKIVYLVDVAQSLHFQQLFVMASRLHQADPTFPITEFKHVIYGRMAFADAAMSTRKGNIILGTELLKEAYTRAEKLVKEKSASLSANEQKQIAQGIAMGAVKYAMIAQAPESDFTFDWDKVLSFDGNSAPYLQYTQARANSILKKSREESAPPHSAKSASGSKSQASSDQASLFSFDSAMPAQPAEQAAPFSDTHELALLKSLTLFPAKVRAAATSYKPNILTTYLQELAQSFNSFYGAVPVLKTADPDLLASRLHLVEATAQVLRNGLTLAGITSFEKM